MPRSSALLIMLQTFSSTFVCLMFKDIQLESLYNYFCSSKHHFASCTHISCVFYFYSHSGLWVFMLLYSLF
ncbi:hypothetical protein C8J55DRAFT_526020 [Lentinula edodes]|uniref:Uncharacterized protein n=1 Tax=Lentinula lateritia TaxID=40482 RepID=A0A9W8ZUM4_9AGAR|nr:hypothetical protein C8J55DRAFT_526020 [Lentinula edodes]